MELYGRRRIFSDVTDITKDNVIDVVNEALKVHRLNAAEIEYLRKYHSGRQPILDRVKTIRPEINAKIVVNTAAEALGHKTSYIFGNPVSYVRRNGSKTKADVSVLNDMAEEQGKSAVDTEVAFDFLLCGLGHKATLPLDDDGCLSPYGSYHLFPETTFVVYSNDVFKRPVLGVSYIVKADNSAVFTAYTKTERFEFTGSALSGAYGEVTTTANGIGEIPIVEYRMLNDGAGNPTGVFEKAIPIMDALNEETSDRVNGIAQFVQAILWMNNVEIDEEQQKGLTKSLGLLTHDSAERKASVEYLTAELNQEAVQSLTDETYSHILELCAVPGREQSSGGNTGTAISLGAGGWQKAEDDAKRIETAFKAGERQTIKVILAILRKASKTPAELKGLKPYDVDVKFVRNKTANILAKAQAGLNLKDLGVAPRDIYRECDMFGDPEQIYQNALEGGFIDKAYSEKSANTDVTNQPRGDDGLTQTVENKGKVQTDGGV